MLNGYVIPTTVPKTSEEAMTRLARVLVSIAQGIAEDPEMGPLYREITAPGATPAAQEAARQALTRIANERNAPVPASAKKGSAR